MSIEREQASSWSVKLWERIQDVGSNEEAWGVLEEACGELAPELKLQRETLARAQAHIEMQAGRIKGLEADTAILVEENRRLRELRPRVGDAR